MILERTPIELLVVDDEPITRLDLSDRLRRRGFKVFRAANADQAIRIMDGHPSIQAVMTDLQMPGADERPRAYTRGPSPLAEPAPDPRFRLERAAGPRDAAGHAVPA